MLAITSREFIDIMVPCLLQAAKMASHAGQITILQKKHELIDGAEDESDRISRVDVFSNVDVAIQEMFLKIILEHWPFVSILAEEDSPTKIKFPTSSQYTVLIDPIDGTRNYLRGSPEYCHIISLAHDRKMLVTLLYSHALEQLYVAAQSEGAFLVSDLNQFSVIRIPKSSTNVLFHHVSRIPKTVLEAVESIGLKPAISVQNASNIMTLLDGKATGFVSYTPLVYDVWSPGMIIQEAGGWVSDWLGHPLIFDGRARLQHILIASSFKTAGPVIEKLSKFV